MGYCMEGGLATLWGLPGVSEPDSGSCTSARLQVEVICGHTCDAEKRGP